MSQWLWIFGGWLLLNALIAVTAYRHGMRGPAPDPCDKQHESLHVIRAGDALRLSSPDSGLY